MTAGKPRALVAGPDMLARRRTALALRRAGVQMVEETETGREALLVLAERLMDAVFIPWTLDDMTALDFLAATARPGPNRGLPVVIVGENPSTPQRVDAVKAGAAGFLPEGQGDLTEWIQDVLAKNPRPHHAE
ncbi:MAG: response regulator [Deltaproteobacteria bacterium]|nr:response regulator [Deltaproteobacteria bacterium]